MRRTHTIFATLNIVVLGLLLIGAAGDVYKNLRMLNGVCDQDVNFTGTIQQSGETLTGVVMDGDFTASQGMLRKTGNGTYAAILDNIAASVAPTVNEDSGDGYSVGSRWLDTTNSKVYVCLDATVGAAVWVDLSGSGSAGGSFIDDTTIKTDNYAITDAETNDLFILGRATAADKTFTLPTLSDNLGETFWAMNKSSYLLTVIGEQRGTDAVDSATDTVITASSHGFSPGMVLMMTSGGETGEWRRIASVTTDTITLESALSDSPSASETFEVRDSINGEYSCILGFGEFMGFKGSDETDDEWTKL